MQHKSVLYVVATPIGNLADISERARTILSEVDLIVAEDTRHSRKLLNHYGITAKLLSLHQHNEQSRAPQLIERLQAGESIAMISDAGTPAISDPGYLVVQQVAQAGIDVRPIPGPSSLTAVLSVAGMPADKFQFCGFLPSKATQRQAALQALKLEKHTLVFFEAPHRILAFLDDVSDQFEADRDITIGREVSKYYETYYYGTAASIKQTLQDNPEQMNGEFVVCVAGSTETKSVDTVELERLLKLLLEELPLSGAVKLAAKISGVKRNQVYEIALELSEE